MSYSQTAGSDELQEGPGGAVVSGVAGDWGLQIARALAERGHPVHVTDPDGTVAGRVADELGAPAFASSLDVRSLTACRAAAARTRRRTGSLAVWVNNAAARTPGRAWELDERTRQRMLEVNLSGTINGTLAALELMRTQEQGIVINVVSLSGLLTAPGNALYSAFGQAVLAFSLGTLADLRQEAVDSVGVCCLGLGRKGITPAALNQLIDHPRPLTAVPPWRGTVLRASYLRPWLAPVGMRLLGPPAEPAGGPTGRRRRRSA